MTVGGKYETQMCVAIIEDLFGKIVAKVAETLLKESCQLRTLEFKLKNQVTPILIKKSLTTLINFGFVKFFLDTNKKSLYVAEPDNIRHALSAPRACLIAKTLYGPNAEAICEELFSQGKLTCSMAIRRVMSRDENATLMSLKKSFTDLANSQFIIRNAKVEGELHGVPQFSTQFDPFVMPENIMDMTGRKTVEGSNRKRKVGEGGVDGDAGEYWRLNWNRFDAYLRDEMIVDFLIGGTNASTSEDHTHRIVSQTCQMIFKLNELRCSSLKPANVDNFTAAVYDIVKMAKDNGMQMTKADIDLSCQILCDESDGVVRRIGDTGGGLFQIDVRRAIRLICRAHLESLIREQFETRAIRIMHLLETRHYLDEEQVEKQSMLSGKEARETLYALVEEGYIFTKAVGRSGDFQPARTIYLYYVDLLKTVQGLTEYTCKLIRNLILRNSSERKQNQPLLDKDATVGPIVEGIKANDELDDESKLAQIAEVEEMYLPGPDRLELTKFRKAQAVLLASQDSSARVLLAFKLFLSNC